MSANNEDIVKIAYEMAVGPHRYEEFARLLYDKFDSNTNTQSHGLNIDATEQDIKAAFGAVESHFSNADSILQAQGRQKDSALSSMKDMEADSRPRALLDANGRVFYANACAKLALGLKDGGRLSPDLFEHGQAKILSEHLKSLDDYDQNTVISVFGLISPDSSETINFTLVKVNTHNGQIMGHISAALVRWSPKIGRQFQSLLKLTPVEFEITKAIVTGMSLADLADKRGRSVGTVRLQAKKLLTKLGLRSQTELACLYAGFSKFDVQNADAPTLEPWRERHEFERPGNRILEYEIIGHKSAAPVLFFPALIGGMVITKEMRTAITNNGIRLIMVWRPGFSNSNGYKANKPFERLAEYTQDISELLDHLKIEKCPIFGHITSAIYAYGMAKHFPARVSKVVMVNGIVPSVNGDHVKHLEFSEQFRQNIIRHTPKIGKMFIKSALSYVDKGYDLEFMHVFMKKSEVDLNTIKREYIQSAFRREHDQILYQGYDAFIDELLLCAQDWQSLVDGTQCPIIVFVGEDNIFYTPQLYKAYGQNNPKIDINIVPNTGHLLFYQNPEVIFAEIFKAKTQSTR